MIDLICMCCFKPANDAVGGYEVDEDGDIWNYCRACDVWTSHPMTDAEATDGPVQ